VGEEVVEMTNTTVVTASCSNCGQVSETRVDGIITKVEEERIKCHRCGNWTARLI
jgi:ribosomal protein S27AE